MKAQVNWQKFYSGWQERPGQVAEMLFIPEQDGPGLNLVETVHAAFHIGYQEEVRPKHPHGWFTCLVGEPKPHPEGVQFNLSLGQPDASVFLSAWARTLERAGISGRFEYRPVVGV